MLKTTAWIYAGLACVVALFQFALAAGQPWGHLTMGGQFPGVLPATMRAAAVAQGLLLLAMALVVLARAGVLARAFPGWMFWGALTITAMTMALNLVTPSAPERLLWGPVTVLMMLCIVIVAVKGRGR